MPHMTGDRPNRKVIKVYKLKVNKKEKPRRQPKDLLLSRIKNNRKQGEIEEHKD